ncbi:hypothetical protein [uncultured Mitsuokella sp.]|uniref:hypothetical protein n=1 Tax=uncultured Mitsuokella sp. TaxID=453120 RepID=UPI0026040366|nr:hypothetical protein [uncultured Mitsuokella sp.]
MSFLTLWNRVDTLGGYLLGGGGTKRQVILSVDMDRFALPVTPQTYKVQTEQNNVVVDIIDFGEAQLFGNPKLKRLSFSCFFPHPRHGYPFVVGDGIEPSECVAKIEKWKEAKKPVRVIITDSPFNLMMAVKSFDYHEQDGSRDIYFDLDFVEWKDLNTPMANNDKQVDANTGLKNRPVESTPPRPNAIARARDVLEASRKAYGDFARWRTLARGSSPLAMVALRTVRNAIQRNRAK